MQQQNKQRKKT